MYFSLFNPVDFIDLDHDFYIRYPFFCRLLKTDVLAEKWTMIIITIRRLALYVDGTILLHDAGFRPVAEVVWKGHAFHFLVVISILDLW